MSQAQFIYCDNCGRMILWGQRCLCTRFHQHDLVLPRIRHGKKDGRFK